MNQDHAFANCWMHQRSTSYARQDVVEFPHIMFLVQCYHNQIHSRIQVPKQLPSSVVNSLCR
ncbi:hypothetical protein POPTR_017G143760v4 [Populus trichocarpa]|uniref:Uncharacterized protein n=1 Tax=Populus trichocarpa TaxID=3694 RepID=A0ACC0RRU9_POPTR|nr:hypothetical protein POPTR_017G143760v4 [Populus trichocarpa]